ncbi:hypothetical protein E2C01_097819 [Portunus trituberculatus]|uniref:Uncharacterized protein n=1 Tax=Portunus trituberculatus TaxID=210409 RepID=A0A5B7KAJ0_PORTR|nr:hypothetical protein [Portunus trituberculatus]
MLDTRQSDGLIRLGRQRVIFREACSSPAWEDLLALLAFRAASFITRSGPGQHRGAAWEPRIATLTHESTTHLDGSTRAT